MSISDEISRIQDNIASSYTALEEQGATLPESRNSDNLAETIRSVTVGGAGLEIGDISTALYVDESLNKRRYLNGQIIENNKIHKNIIDFLTELKNTNPEFFATESNWQAESALNVDGCVYKFVLNYADDGVTVLNARLPKYPDYVEVTKDSVPVVGNGMALGLTNGTINFVLNSENGQVGVVGSIKGFGQPYGSSASTGLSTANVTAGVTTDPTKSGLIADLSNSQNQTKLKLRYFIQINTGSERKEDVLSTLKQNTPYSFGDSKYSPIELNNVSWLRSNGQWNAKTVYPDYYNWLLEQRNKGVKQVYGWNSTNRNVWTLTENIEVGTEVYTYNPMCLAGSVTSFTDTSITYSDIDGSSYTCERNNSIDVEHYIIGFGQVNVFYPNEITSSSASKPYNYDYDFVLNRADETFRLPLLDGSEDLLSNVKTYLTDELNANGTGAEFTAPSNGWYYSQVVSGASNYIDIYNSSKNSGAISANGTVRSSRVMTKVRRGDKVSVYFVGNISGFYFMQAVGNGSLYYYVGETVQDADLINAGRMQEQLATKTDKVQAAQASMPSHKYIDLTLGASGSTYTAPANGWFMLNKAASAPTDSTWHYAYLHNNTNKVESYQIGNYNHSLVCLIPVLKGDNIYCEYNANGDTRLLRFIYAQGEV